MRWKDYLWLFLVIGLPVLWGSLLLGEVSLCPPNLCSNSVVLNPPLAPHRGVKDFLVSPTGERVFYSADISFDSKYELYSVPITGGQSTKLNAALVNNDYDVDGYEVTPDGITVVYRAGRTDDGNWALYRVGALGGSVLRVSKTVTGSIPVDRNFKIAPDGQSVVYLLTDPPRNLYSTPLFGPSSTRINQSLTPGGNVMPGISVDGDGHVRYRADAEVDNRFVWWLGRVGGGVVMREIFSENFDSGTKGGFQ